MRASTVASLVGKCAQRRRRKPVAMLSRSRPRTRGGHASHIDGSKRGAWEARREWQAALALLVDMARLQGQVDVMEQAAI